MHSQFKTQKFKHLMLAMGPRDLNSAPYSPVHCSSHSMTSFQSSDLTELPVVENSQLFAQRAHSARYAPKDGPRAQTSRNHRTKMRTNHLALGPRSHLVPRRQGGVVPGRAAACQVEGDDAAPAAPERHGPA